MFLIFFYNFDVLMFYNLSSVEELQILLSPNEDAWFMIGNEIGLESGWITEKAQGTEC